MTFDGINYLAVLVAALAAWLLAIAWYMLGVIMHGYWFVALLLMGAIGAFGAG